MFLRGLVGVVRVTAMAVRGAVSGRNFWAVAAAAVCAVVVFGGPVAVVAAPPAGSVSRVAPSGSDEPVLAGGDLVAADEASASALAFRSNRRVLVTGSTSEVSRTWAWPDGTFQAELHAAPVRVSDGSGNWVDVDLALERRPDGGVGPRAHARGVWLSGARSAGSEELVTLGVGAGRVALGWRGALPEPVLDGPRATYPEVRADVDLVVEVGRTGFQYFLVLKSPQAAEGLGRIAMPWDDGGSGAARGAGDGSGQQGLVVSEAYMWDARVSPQTGEPERVAPVAVSTEQDAGGGGTDLVLTPDAEFLADPDIVYPVTVDPSVDLNPAFDAFVQNTIPNSDMSGSNELKLGRVVDAAEGCSSACVARSFLSFHSLSGYRGSQVVKAELFLWNFHSYSCTATSWQSWRVSYVTTSARWGSQPDWQEQDGTSTGTKGYNSGCADGWVSVSVKKTFQNTFSSTSSSTANVGLRATSESGNNGWKRFNSSEASSRVPYVDLRFNRTPNVPNQLSIDSCYSACGSPAVVRSGAPRISARVSDPDWGSLRLEFEVFNNAKTVVVARSGTAVTGVVHNTVGRWTVVPLSGSVLPDATYHWRARACDAYICGDYSAWFTVTVDTDDVSLPGVAGDPYLEKSTGTWNGGPGQAGTFTLGPGSETNVAEYAYSVNGGAVTTVPAGVAQGQLLTANQQSVTTGLTGFVAGSNANVFHSSAGHDAAGSLRVNPNGTGDSNGALGDTFAAVGGDSGFQLGMQPGKRYWITGWILVPATSGLSTPGTWGQERGLRIVGFHRVGSAYTATASPRASVTDSWQRLSMVMSVPADATEAFVRLYNGHATGSGRAVWWDDLSAREVIGSTAVEQVTPTKDGLNVLSVQSRNAAGSTSDPRVYQFLVTPSSGSWYWGLDEKTGTAAASTPSGRSASRSATGASWSPGPGAVGDGAAVLDGTGELATADPVLDTGAAAGFTVAALVLMPVPPEPDPEDPPVGPRGWQTVLSQDGVNTSMFRLGYRDDYDPEADGVFAPAWCFSITIADAAAAGSVDACTTDLTTPGHWVSLVGVYDKPTSTIRLYVNGTADFGGAEATASMPVGWSATGPLALGRGWQSGLAAERLTADIDHVYAVQSVWPDSRISQHAFF